MYSRNLVNRRRSLSSVLALWTLRINSLSYRIKSSGFVFVRNLNFRLPSGPKSVSSNSLSPNSSLRSGAMVGGTVQYVEPLNWHFH